MMKNKDEHSNPKVSVCTTTYNHKQYIGQCLDSILAQKTDFMYEMLVGEDDSKDGTRELCRQYAERHPERIRLFLNDRKNVIYINGRATGRWNFLNLLKHARGKYVALCPGDDYWTDPHKLQKQADFLDTHPECSMCFHDVWAEYEYDDRPPQIAPPRGRKNIYTLRDLLKGNFIQTCSVMFRRGLFPDFPDWFSLVAHADWPLYILNAEHGDVGFVPGVMGTYRIHARGIFSSLADADQIMTVLSMYPYINRHLNYRYNRLIRSRMIWRTFEKRTGIFLQKFGFVWVVNIYRKLFYGKLLHVPGRHDQ